MKKFVKPTDPNVVESMYKTAISRVEDAIKSVPIMRERLEQAIAEKHQAKDIKAVRALAVKMSLLRRQELCLQDQKKRLEDRLNGDNCNRNSRE